jgi:hypothetical protein
MGIFLDSAIRAGIEQGIKLGFMRWNIDEDLKRFNRLPVEYEKLLLQMPFNGYHCEDCRTRIVLLNDYGYASTAGWLFFDRHVLTQKGIDYLNDRPSAGM